MLYIINSMIVSIEIYNLQGFVEIYNLELYKVGKKKPY